MTVPRPGLAEALFGRTRRSVLALLFGQPERSFYLREIAVRAGGGMGQVQKELGRLAAAGLVERERRGNQVHFRANRGAPIFGELASIVTKTFGVADVLREALAPHASRIRLALVFGSVARGTAGAASDIDLFVVGDLAPSELAVALDKAGERLGRRVSMIAYSSEELRSMLRERRHFVDSVLAGPKLWLLGDDRTLDELRQEKPRKPRSRRAARG